MFSGRTSRNSQHPTPLSPTRASSLPARPRRDSGAAPGSSEHPGALRPLRRGPRTGADNARLPPRAQPAPPGVSPQRAPDLPGAWLLGGRPETPATQRERKVGTPAPAPGPPPRCIPLAGAEHLHLPGQGWRALQAAPLGCVQGTVTPTLPARKEALSPCAGGRRGSQSAASAIS